MSGLPVSHFVAPAFSLPLKHFTSLKHKMWMFGRSFLVRFGVEALHGSPGSTKTTEHTVGETGLSTHGKALTERTQRQHHQFPMQTKNKELHRQFKRAPCPEFCPFEEAEVLGAKPVRESR